MRKIRYFADDYVHLHPGSLLIDRRKVEKELRDSRGVFSVHFDTDEIRNAILVAYNPEVISSEILLEIIRKSYVKAVRVACAQMRVTIK